MNQSAEQNAEEIETVYVKTIDELVSAYERLSNEDGELTEAAIAMRPEFFFDLCKRLLMVEQWCIESDTAEGYIAGPTGPTYMLGRGGGAPT